MTEGKLVEKKESKPEAIQRAMQDLRKVVRRLQDFTRQIEGTGQPVVDKSQEPPLPCLSSILTALPDEIHEECDAIVKSVNSLENSLF